MSRIAFLFPGQGSQSVGMLSGLGEAHARVRATFEEAGEALGYDLWSLCQQGPEAELNRTEITQPAVLAADIATWRAWRENGGPAPAVMAGHSLGEYAALVAAGAMEFAPALRLVAERGRLMQQAVPEGEGAMAAVLGMDDAALERVCAEQAHGQVVSCANFNAPGQVVIAGHREAVERACEAARAAGAKRAMTLPVSVPSHCLLMKEASQELARALEGIEIESPTLPVIHNVDVSSHADPEDIRSALVRQLWQPVQWTRTVQLLAAEGAGPFVECGPGRVLAGLNKRIDRALETVNLSSAEGLLDALEKAA